MGSQNSLTRDIGQFNLDQWEPISQDIGLCSNNSTNQIVIYQNKACKYLQMEMYPLLFSGPSQYMAYADMLAWRNSQQNFVPIKYISSELKKSLCSNFYLANVFIQRMPQRMKSLQPVSIEVYTYLLSVSLQSFRRVYDKIGYFQIESQLFCINNEGNLKIWLNSNLSKNYPEFSKINHNKDDHDFVMDIIKKVEKVANKSINPSFSVFVSHMIGTEKINFKSAIKLLDAFMKKYGIEKITTTKQKHITRKASVKNSLASSVVGDRSKTNTLYQYNMGKKKTAKKIITHKKNQQFLQQAKGQNIYNKESNGSQQGLTSRSKSPSLHKPKKLSNFEKQEMNTRPDLNKSSSYFQYKVCNRVQMTQPIGIFNRYQTSPLPLVPTVIFHNESMEIPHKKKSLKQNFREQIKEIQKNSSYYSSSSYDMDPEIKRDLANFQV